MSHDAKAQYKCHDIVALKQREGHKQAEELLVKVARQVQPILRRREVGKAQWVSVAAPQRARADRVCHAHTCSRALASRVNNPPPLLQWRVKRLCEFFPPNACLHGTCRPAGDGEASHKGFTQPVARAPIFWG
jgi:hypothetical protein